MKKSKQTYYDKCFERNWNNINNTSFDNLRLTKINICKKQITYKIH